MEKLQKSHIILALIFLTAVLYSRSVFFDYTLMDDHELIQKNWAILSDLKNIGRVFGDDVFFSPTDAYYRPMLALSFMWDAQWGNRSLVPFHIANIVLHIICGLLVWLLLQQCGFSLMRSSFFAFFFVLHPTLSQAVAWVPGRNDSLLTLFILFSFILFLQYHKSGSFIAVMGHQLTFLAALLTKETMILFPLVCFSFWLLIDRPQRLRLMAFKLAGGWLIIVLIYGFLRSRAMSAPITIDWAYLLRSFFSSVPAGLQYLGKIFFPVQLSVLPTITDTSFLWGIVAVFILAMLIFFQRESISWHWVGFGLIWYLLFLWPSFLRPNPAIMINFLEHRLYLPIVGIMLIFRPSSPRNEVSADVAVAAQQKSVSCQPSGFWIQNRLLKRLSIWFKLKKQKLTTIMAMGVLLAFMTLTWRHIEVFKNKQTFWENAAKTSPSANLAQFNLGVVYYQIGEKDKAAEQFHKCIALDSKDIASWVNLGILAREGRDFIEAENYFLKALSLDSTYGFAYNELAAVYLEMGKTNRAREALYAALRHGFNTQEVLERLTKIEKSAE